MKIAPKFHIEKATTDDPGPAVLEGVYLDCRKPEQHLAIGTNGRLLVAVPIEDVQDSESGKLVPRDAFKVARKLAGKRGTSEIGVNDVITFADKSTMPIPEHLATGNFPHWQQVVPRDNDRKGSIKISLNPHLLAQVVAALGGSEIGSIDIEIFSYVRPGEMLQNWNYSPFYITARQSPGAFAVLMPMRMP